MEVSQNGITERLLGFNKLGRTRKIGERTIRFSLFSCKENKHSFDLVQHESIITFDGDDYIVKNLKEKGKGDSFRKDVVATHSFFGLVDDFCYEVQSGSFTLVEALDYVLNGTGYTYSVEGVFYAQSFENFGDSNRHSMFVEVMKRYEAEFEVNGNHITIKKKIGRQSDFQFRYKYNIKGLSTSGSTRNLSTYIEGFGEDGLHVTYTSPNAAKIGIKHAKPIRDERFTDETELLNKLKTVLVDAPEISFSIDFIDLRNAGFPFDVPDEGDDVFLIYEPMSLDIEIRILEVDEEFDKFEKPIKTKVTLGNVRQSMSSKLASQQKKLSNMTDDTGKVKFSFLDAQVQRSTEALQSAQTEVEFSNGLILRDKNDPNLLVLLNSSGVGISRNNGQTFTEAITSEGFNLSAGAIGYLLADYIRGGTLLLGGLNNTNGKFQVQDEQGEIIADLDAERGGFSDLYVANLDSPTVVKNGGNVGTWNLYVASYSVISGFSPSDENTGNDWYSPLRTISEAMRRIPTYFSGTVNIILAGSFNEDISVTGFLGDGTINVDGETRNPSVNGRIFVAKNTVMTRINNFTHYGNNTYSNIHIADGAKARIDSVKSFGTGNTSFHLDVNWGAFVQVFDSEFYDCNKAICARYGGTVMQHNNKGHANSYGTYTYSGTVKGYGTCPIGDSATSGNDAGGITDFTFTPDGGSYTPPPPPETTKQWSSRTDSATYRLDFNYWDDDTFNNMVLQGKYAGYGLYEGCWFFGSDVKSSVQSKTIKQIRFKPTRLNQGGYSTGVQVTFRTHNYATRPSGNPSIGSTTMTANFAWGESKWITLPESFHDLFENGTAQGIAIYTSSTAGDKYAKFDENATLEITYS
ncbi:phage tail protein [Bacillus sp. 2205SS5-2]|uniref:phage tail protein n=1 Tax=Bacillus sp. 2205SS5-2 TaxID=3109031 RepID=UPI003005D1BB